MIPKFIECDKNLTLIRTLEMTQSNLPSNMTYTSEISFYFQICFFLFKVKYTSQQQKRDEISNNAKRVECKREREQKKKTFPQPNNYYTLCIPQILFQKATVLFVSSHPLFVFVPKSHLSFSSSQFWFSIRIYYLCAYVQFILK